jgi:hypothetical protein
VLSPSGSTKKIEKEQWAKYTFPTARPAKTAEQDETSMIIKGKKRVLDASTQNKPPKKSFPPKQARTAKVFEGNLSTRREKRFKMTLGTQKSEKGVRKRVRHDYSYVAVGTPLQ